MSTDILYPISPRDQSVHEGPRTTESVPGLPFDDICKRDRSGRIVEIDVSSRLDTALDYGRVVPLGDYIAELEKTLNELSNDERGLQMAFGPMFRQSWKEAIDRLNQGYSHINVRADLRVYPNGVYYRPGESVRPLKKYHEPSSSEVT